MYVLTLCHVKLTDRYHLSDRLIWGLQSYGTLWHWYALSTPLYLLLVIGINKFKKWEVIQKVKIALTICYFPQVGLSTLTSWWNCYHVWTSNKLISTTNRARLVPEPDVTVTISVLQKSKSSDNSTAVRILFFFLSFNIIMNICS